MNEAPMDLNSFLQAERIIGSIEIRFMQSCLAAMGQPPLTDGQAMIVLRHHLKNTLRAAATVLSAPAAGVMVLPEIADSTEEDLDDWLSGQQDCVRGGDIPRSPTHAKN